MIQEVSHKATKVKVIYGGAHVQSEKALLCDSLSINRLIKPLTIHPKLIEEENEVLTMGQ